MANFTLDPVRNFALCTLVAGYAAGVTSISVSSGQGARLPDTSTEGAFNMIWYNMTDYTNPTDDPDHEIVRVTTRSTDTLTILRAQEGTSDVAHNTVGKTYGISLDLTRKMITDIQTGIRRTAGQLVTSGGTANAQTLSVDSNITALAAGDRFVFIAGASNTGAMTLNVNGIGAVTTYGDSVEMPANTVKSGWVYEVIYDGTNFRIVGGNTNLGPVLVSRLSFSNSSAAQDTGTITSASNYKYFEIRMSGYRNTASGSGQMRVTVNAIGGTAYEHTLQSGNTTYGAPITGAAYWTMYSGVLDDKSLIYSWFVSNVKAPTGKVMFAANAQYFHSDVSANGQVALGSDSEISKFTFTPMDGGSADPITMVIEVFGYY